MDKTTEDDALLPTPTGPALLYTGSVNSQSANAVLVLRVDLDAVADPRERAICRALLQHALALLDATEPTRKAPVMEGRRL